MNRPQILSDAEIDKVEMLLGPISSPHIVAPREVLFNLCAQAKEANALRNWMDKHSSHSFACDLRWQPPTEGVACTCGLNVVLK